MMISALVKKEFNSFLSQPVGYLLIFSFLLILGLFLWIFPNPYNIFQAEYANLQSFFTLTAWVLTFLIPAIAMRSFADEKKQGTLELLLTQPISVNQLVMSKFAGLFLVSLVAILPTLIYLISLYQLAANPTNIDINAIIASYLGLLFLISVNISICLFTSSLSENQLIAFISGAAGCLLFYYGFNGLMDLFSADILVDFFKFMSVKEHFNSISRGVIDSRDVVFFLSLTFLFIKLTTFKINRHA